jgi:hypothetical protein
MGSLLRRVIVSPLVRSVPLCAAVCLAQSSPLDAQSTASEQEILGFILREHGAGAAVNDSTWSHTCRNSDDRICERPLSVDPELWANYLDAIRSRMAVRDLLPVELRVTFTSDLAESASTACALRSRKIELSRAGLSRDGNAAIVSYAVWMPMDHLGCGAVSGRTILLRRTPAGHWEVVETLSMVVS